MAKNERDPFAHLTGLPHQLATALLAASDHLDYCGYGDSWEREGALGAKLPEEIQNALAAAMVGGLDWRADNFTKYGEEFGKKEERRRR